MPALNRLGYRTGNTWTEKRVQRVRRTKGIPAFPSPDRRPWITMQQAAQALGVGEMVVRGLISEKALPTRRIVKFAPWTITRANLDLPWNTEVIGQQQLGGFICRFKPGQC